MSPNFNNSIFMALESFGSFKKIFLNFYFKNNALNINNPKSYQSNK